MHILFFLRTSYTAWALIGKTKTGPDPSERSTETTERSVRCKDVQVVPSTPVSMRVAPSTTDKVMLSTGNRRENQTSIQVKPWVTPLWSIVIRSIGSAQEKEGQFHFKNFLKASKWCITYHTCSIITKTSEATLDLDIPGTILILCIRNLVVIGYQKWHLISKF